MSSVPLKFSVIETTMSPLWDFGWFDLTRFEVNGPGTERQSAQDVLRGFLRDPISQRSFCTPGPWGAPIDHHGPFPSEKLMPDWYQPVSPPELANRVQMALNDPWFEEPPSPKQVLPVESWVKAVEARGDIAFVLDAPSQPDPRVYWAFVWTVFHEFVCLSCDQLELEVAVIGYD